MNVNSTKNNGSEKYTGSVTKPDNTYPLSVHMHSEKGLENIKLGVVLLGSDLHGWITEKCTVLNIK